MKCMAAWIGDYTFVLGLVHLGCNREVAALAAYSSFTVCMFSHTYHKRLKWHWSQNWIQD